MGLISALPALSPLPPPPPKHPLMGKKNETWGHRLACVLIFLRSRWSPQPHVNGVVQFMMVSNQDADTDLALEACEFW